MDNTCCEGKCPWVKIGFCKEVEECPNFVESWWHEGQTGNQKLVRDCAPKRIMLQISNLHSRLEGVQCATEQVRNECAAMKGHFMALENASRQFLNDESIEMAQIQFEKKSND